MTWADEVHNEMEDQRELRHQILQLRIALEQSVTAIDDWLNTFAAEFCQFERVQEARQRISEKGTLAYIAHVQQINRVALACSASDRAGGK